MKYLKISILTVLLIVSGSYVKAQNTESGSSPFAITLHASPPMTFFTTNLKSDTYSNEEIKGLGYNVGADLMYYFITKDKFRAYVSLGVGLSNYRSFRGLSYEHSISTTDIDGDNVLITETVNDMYEKLSLRYLDIPLKFGFEFPLAEKVDAYVSVGATYGFNLKGEYENQATLTRNGFYPAYNALVFDVDVVGSPYFYPTNKRMTNQDEIAIKKNFSLQAAFGMKYKLNAKLSFLLGVKYMHGLTDVIDENSLFIVKHDDQYNHSLNSLATRGDKIKTRGLGLEFGLQINLW